MSTYTIDAAAKAASRATKTVAIVATMKRIAEAVRDHLQQGKADEELLIDVALAAGDLVNYYKAHNSKKLEDNPKGLIAALPDIFRKAQETLDSLAASAPVAYHDRNLHGAVLSLARVAAHRNYCTKAYNAAIEAQETYEEAKGLWSQVCDLLAVAEPVGANDG